MSDQKTNFEVIERGKVAQIGRAYLQQIITEVEAAAITRAIQAYRGGTIHPEAALAFVGELAILSEVENKIEREVQLGQQAQEREFGDGYESSE